MREVMRKLARSMARRPGRVLLVVAFAGAVGLGAVSLTRAADHVDSPVVENTASIDVADLYAFRSPQDPDRLVLAMTLHGFIPPSESGMSIFEPNVLYQFKIDTDGDAVEDRVIQAFVTESGSGQTMHVRGPASPMQTGTQNRVLSGSDAATVEVTTSSNPQIAEQDGLRVFAGVRDDPFFFDFGRFQEIVAGEASSFEDPGTDAFAGFNVYAIVVELPVSRLGGGSEFGVWSTVSRRQ